MNETNVIQVNTQHLDVKDMYVCMIDMMGTHSIMSESFERSANFLLRFHSVVNNHCQNDKSIHVYPVMDAVYLATGSLEKLRDVLNGIFCDLVKLLLSETNNRQRFLVRGSIAFGQVFEGRKFNEEICPQISNNSIYAKNLLLGLPLIQAHQSEQFAPPMGIFIHESARKYHSLQGRYYQWWRGKENEKNDFERAINEYFNWCRDQHISLGMELEKIEKYQTLNKEHFGMFEEPNIANSITN